MPITFVNRATPKTFESVAEQRAAVLNPRELPQESDLLAKLEASKLENLRLSAENEALRKSVDLLRETLNHFNLGSELGLIDPT